MTFLVILIKINFVVVGNLSLAAQSVEEGSVWEETIFILGIGQLDLFYLGDVMYALGFNITKKICMQNGQQEEEAKKFANFDEVVALVGAALKTPENHGNYHDYVELCKLYDKNENGTMMLAELENILSNLADEIPKEDTLALLAELADPEDEDGFFPYTPFLDRLCGKA